MLIITELLDYRLPKYKWQRLCKCVCDCGNEVVRPLHYILNKKSNSCGCGRATIYLTKDITLPFWNKLKECSFRHGRQLEFDITPEYLQEIWEEQNGCCYLTGEKLYISKTRKEKDSRMTTASVDRIDSKLGYIKGNVKFVLKTVNMMKWALTLPTFLDWCRKVTHNATETPKTAK